MDKRLHGLASAMREIADQRDDQLRNGGVISPQRREQLNAFLAATRPVETALGAVARRRDESLTMAEPALPTAVHAALMEQARSLRGAARAVHELRRLVGSRGAYHAAAALAAAFAVAFTALYSFRAGNPQNRIPSDSRLVSFAVAEPPAFSHVSIFERSADQLALRANRLELASLERSLLTINRSLPDFERADRVLPLDLPIRQIRLDVEAVRTP